MKTFYPQKGFTLVELAIVMTIIGLLIGGILKGQELMENARVTATISQVKSYEAATTTFRDAYSAIPGDMANANTRIPNCAAAACSPIAGTAGNSVVGRAAAAINISQANGGGGGGLMGNDMNETVLFWVHLLFSDLISGVSNNAITGVGPANWGDTHPAGKIGGGFRVANGDGFAVAGSGAAVGPAGLQLVLAQSPSLALAVTGGTQPLIPGKAAQIDRKMDDGKALTGFVRAYGAPPCFAVANSYNEQVTTKDCGLVFRLQG